MNGVGGVDASSGAGDADAHRRDDDDELARLRQQEAALGAAYRQSPGDMATMGALVRVQQAIRRHDEDAARTADNGRLASEPADLQIRGYGVRLPMASADASAVHLDTPVSHLSTTKEVQDEIDAITRTIGFATFAGAGFAANIDPKLLVRLGQLQTRLSEVERAERTPVTAPHVALSPFHSPPEAHEGNAAQLAEMHVELTTAIHASTFPTALATMTYANQYIAFTAKHPEMRDLHDHAVAALDGLVDAAVDREAERARGEQRANDQAGWLQTRTAPGSGLLLAEGAFGLLSAQTVHAIGGLVPVAGELQSGLEALAGHGMWGLGEEKIEGIDRLLVGVTALCALAPYARKILNGAEAEETVARIAQENGKTEEEIRGLLRTSVKIDNGKAKVRAALEKAKAGGDIDAAEQEAVDSVRGVASTREGVPSGNVARAARNEPPLKLDEHPTGSGGGPGVWLAKRESMSPTSSAFQESVSGVRAGGHTYKVGDVEFDGVRVDAGGKVTLLEAKGDYAQFLVNGVPKPFIDWRKILLDKVERQAEKAVDLGVKLEVHCLQPEIAHMIRKTLFRFENAVEVFPKDNQ